MILSMFIEILKMITYIKNSIFSFVMFDVFE